MFSSGIYETTGNVVPLVANAATEVSNLSGAVRITAVDSPVYYHLGGKDGWDYTKEGGCIPTASSRVLWLGGGTDGVLSYFIASGKIGRLERLRVVPDAEIAGEVF